MRKLIITSFGLGLLAMSTTAFASDALASQDRSVTTASQEGWYVGVKAGSSSVHTKKNTSAEVVDESTGDTVAATAQQKISRGLAYGVFGGYNFSEFLAVEGGLTKLHGGTIKETIALNGTSIYSGNATQNFYVLDILAKGTFPITDALGVYGKGGFALVNSKTRAEYYDLATDSLGGKNTSTKNFLRPELALGVQYAVAENWAVNVEYSRILGRGHTGEKNYLPSLDLMSIGVQYGF